MHRACTVLYAQSQYRLTLMRSRHANSLTQPSNTSSILLRVCPCMCIHTSITLQLNNLLFNNVIQVFDANEKSMIRCFNCIFLKYRLIFLNQSELLRVSEMIVSMLALVD